MALLILLILMLLLCGGGYYGYSERMPIGPFGSVLGLVVFFFLVILLFNLFGGLTMWHGYYIR